MKTASLFCKYIAMKELKVPVLRRKDERGMPATSGGEPFPGVSILFFVSPRVNPFLIWTAD